ncbi:MAG: hercynine metabolism protein [Cyanobacteriota bacterium]
MSGDWFEELESRLNARLERFLEDNPEQDALLQRQEQRERREDLIERRRQLQTQAEQERQTLLQLAEEIRQWQQRIQRAREAGAGDLAERARQHLSSLMDRGRLAWEQLGRLGQSWEAVNRELEQVRQQDQQNRGSQRTSSADLEREWTAFEADQELERLRQRRSP